MNKVLLVFLSALLGGCATSAKPNFVNGNFYMGGDSKCTQYRVYSDYTIICFNKNGEKTEYRHAMTNQELEMYKFNRSQDAQDWRDINESLRAASRSLGTKRYETYD